MHTLTIVPKYKFNYKTQKKVEIKILSTTIRMHHPQGIDYTHWAMHCQKINNVCKLFHSLVILCMVFRQTMRHTYRAKTYFFTLFFSEIGCI